VSLLDMLFPLAQNSAVHRAFVPAMEWVLHTGHWRRY